MRAAIVSTVMLLAGCGSHERASEHTDAPQPAIATDVAPAVVGAGVATPAARTTTPPPTMPTRAASGPRLADLPRFAKVLVGDGSAGFGRHVLMQTSDGQVFLTAGAALLRLERDGSFEYEPRWTRGIDVEATSFEGYEEGYSWIAPIAMGGTWPEGAYVVLEPMSGGRGDNPPIGVYRRSNDRWNRIATHARLFDTHPIAFGPWKDGSLLALQVFTANYRRWDEEGAPAPAEVAAFERAIAGQKRLVVLRGRPRAPELGRRDVRAFASLPTGEIYAAVAEQDAISIIHHDDVSASEQTHTLPDLAGRRLEDLELRATADDRVWLFAGLGGEHGGAYVARFDGSTWHTVPTDCVDAAHSGSIDDEGNAYFVCALTRADGEPTTAALRWRRGTIEELATGIGVGQVVARSPDDIWAISAPMSAGEFAVVHTGTRLASPATLPTGAEEARDVAEWADAVPLGRRCETPVLPLVTGSDRGAAQRVLAALDRDGVTAEIVDVRIQGRTETAIVVRGWGGEPTRHVRRIAAALGPAVGTPSCNVRPPAHQG